MDFEIEGYEDCGKGYKVFEDGSVVSYKRGRTITDTPQTMLKHYLKRDKGLLSG